jgi:hypothetical protein
MFDSGLIYVTTNYEFFLIEDVEKVKKVKMLSNPQDNPILDDACRNFCVLPGSKSPLNKISAFIPTKRGMLQAFASNAGENYVRVFPQATEQIEFVAISASFTNIAVFTTNSTLLVKSITSDPETQGPLFQTQLSFTEKQKRFLRQIEFVGSDAIALIFKDEIFYVRQGSNGHFKIAPKTCNGNPRLEPMHTSSVKAILAFPEIDGLRVFKQYKRCKFQTCTLVRRMPVAQYNVEWIASIEAGSYLLAGYNAFVSKKPLQHEDIRQIKDKLSSGVQDLITCGIFELDLDQQSKYLKAAAYGKAFLSKDSLDQNKLYDVCKRLKVQYHINKMGRAITYRQIEKISQKNLTSMLIHSRAHFLAIETAKLLKMSLDTYTLIFVDWANNLSLSGRLDQESLAKLIHEKYKELQSTPGLKLSDIA